MGGGCGIEEGKGERSWMNSSDIGGGGRAVWYGMEMGIEIVV